MNKRNLLLTGIAVILLALGVWQAHHITWDWHAIARELRSVSLPRIAIGIACIYAGFVLRAVRWATLMRPQRNVPARELVTPQFIGFTAVALFGRLADLARPALIARRTSTLLAAQIAVYGIERIFDLAAAAIIFSVTLALAPSNVPHHEAIARAGILAASATLALTVVVLAIRFAGDRLAALAARVLQPVSAKAAKFVQDQILSFSAGLNTLRDMRSFFSALIVSIIMWLGVAAAYIETAHAFTLTPQLANMNATQTVLLMATSMGSSLLQVPVLGWFTQIGLVAAAMHALLDVPLPAALASSLLLLFVTLLSLVPIGLIAAQREGISLREAASSSAATEEDALTQQ